MASSKIFLINPAPSPNGPARTRPVLPGGMDHRMDGRRSRIHIGPRNRIDGSEGHRSDGRSRRIGRGRRRQVSTFAIRSVRHSLAHLGTSTSPVLCLTCSPDIFTITPLCARGDGLAEKLCGDVSRSPIATFPAGVDHLPDPHPNHHRPPDQRG